MSEGYCQKACTGCAYRESAECPGCRVGPGRHYGGDCEIAQCARERGHHGCDTCTYQKSCTKLQRSDTMPLYRQRRQQAHEQIVERTEKRVSFSTARLWVLFWLVIPSSIGALLGTEGMAQTFPVAYLIGTLLTIAVAIAYGVILLSLRNQAEGYGTSGICRLITSGVNLAVLGLMAVADVSAQPWAVLLSIPVGIVGLVAERNEYLGHSCMLVNVDDELSDQWDTLWKHYMGSVAGILGSTVLTLILPTIGFLGLLGCVVWLLVVSILKLVYLYRTAREVEWYSRQ